MRVVIVFVIGLLIIGCGGEVETAVSTITPIASPTTTESMVTPSPPHLVTPSSSADADVLFVKATETSTNTWTFSVTVAHPDTGWEDYADGWDVVLPDGTIVKPNESSPFTRLLTHPHETEQPFTRSQSNIVIPETVTAVTVRAHDIVDGFGGLEVVVELETAVTTDTYEVIRLSE